MDIINHECHCGNQHYPIEIEKISNGNDVYHELITYLEEKDFNNIVMQNNKMELYA